MPPPEARFFPGTPLSGDTISISVSRGVPDNPSILALSILTRNRSQGKSGLRPVSKRHRSAPAEQETDVRTPKKGHRTQRKRSTHIYGVRRRVAAFTVCGADGYRLHPPGMGSGLRPVSKRHRDVALQRTAANLPHTFDTPLWSAATRRRFHCLRSRRVSPSSPAERVRPSAAVKATSVCSCGAGD